MEQCRFCGRTVIDEAGNQTEDYGMVRYGKYICVRCKKSFEFSLGI